MNSELQLDVRHLTGERLRGKRQVLFIAGKLCDPCLSALKWFVYHARRYASAWLYGVLHLTTVQM